MFSEFGLTSDVWVLNRFPPSSADRRRLKSLISHGKTIQIQTCVLQGTALCSTVSCIACRLSSPKAQAISIHMRAAYLYSCKIRSRSLKNRHVAIVLFGSAAEGRGARPRQDSAAALAEGGEQVCCAVLFGKSEANSGGSNDRTTTSPEHIVRSSAVWA